MSIDYGGFRYPKGPTRLNLKAARDTLDAKAALAFREAVWMRDHYTCRICKRKVIKTLELVPSRGEVHHLRGRNVAPEDRYRVDRAVLLCARCHRDAQEHKVKVPGL